MKQESGFITITFVLMLATFLTFISLEANNDYQLLQTLIHVENFYEHEYLLESCKNMEELQTFTKDGTYESPCG
jgi:hypothetical protein